MTDLFFRIGCEIMNRPKMAKNKGNANQRFCAMFGATPEVCSIAWSLIQSTNNLPKDGQREHFLWSLIFLKTYQTEDILAANLEGIDEKNYENVSEFL